MFSDRLSAGEFADQLNRAFPGVFGHLKVDAALEAVAGVAGDAEFPAGGADV